MWDGPAGDLAQYTGAPSTASGVSFLYYNGHGDLAATANLSGTRTDAFSYDPFGAAKQTLPANSASERWTGRWDKKHDSTSQLIEMGARPYDPQLGRFLSVDPIDGGSCNIYDYACQDPINTYELTGTKIDPNRGRNCKSIVMKSCKVRKRRPMLQLQPPPRVHPPNAHAPNETEARPGSNRGNLYRDAKNVYDAGRAGAACVGL